MERKYHPRNISEFKEGDLVMRVEMAKLTGREDSSYLGDEVIYSGKVGNALVFTYIGKDDYPLMKNGQKIVLPADSAWAEGWDYVHPEEEVEEKERKEEYKSTLKNTNLTAFLRGSKL